LGFAAKNVFMSPTKAFGVLLAASLLASLASIPFAVRTGNQPATRSPSLSPKSFWSVVICFEAALSALAIATGLWLENGVDLRAPLVIQVLAGEPSPLRELKRGIALAVAVGFGTGTVIAALRIALRSLTPVPFRPATGFMVLVWARLLAAFAAGVREEIWFRFGLMTGLLWGATHVLRTTSNNAAVFWASNVVIALAFGVIHLGQARVLYGLTASYVAFILLLNGVASLVFGWIYWRQGLFAAVAAHGCADVVLQVFSPWIEGRARRQDCAHAASLSSSTAIKQSASSGAGPIGKEDRI
jgi:hypothetical protein